MSHTNRRLSTASQWLGRVPAGMWRMHGVARTTCKAMNDQT